MKQLLAVSWEMPPLSGPRAVQVTRSLCELAAHGWQSRVICFSPRSTRYQQDYAVSPEIESGGAVRLIRVASPEEWFPIRALWRICPPLKRLPDEKRVWIPGALAAARRALTEQAADALMTFAQPWSDHLLGLRLHRETKLPWVAHFSDPWVDSPYASGGWPGRIAARMERHVVAEATRVVFVNQHTADRVMSKYPAEWRQRVRIVPQGFDPRRLRTSPRDRRPGPLRIVYTGRFYDGLRTPDTLLASLTQLKADARLAQRLQLELVGGAAERYRRRATALGLDDVVTFTGRVTPDEALTRAAAADVLLVIDAPSDGPNLFLPSKLIDYLPFATPILGITPGDGATAELLRRLGYATVDPRDATAIAETIERLVQAHEAGSLSTAVHHLAVAGAYDIRETTRALDAVLQEAASAA